MTATRPDVALELNGEDFDRLVRALEKISASVKQAIAVLTEDAGCEDRGEVIGSHATYTCVYETCADQHLVLDPAAAERWMDAHAQEVAHDPRWPITFRIDYPHSRLVGTAYRDPVKLASARPGAGT